MVNYPNVCVCFTWHLSYIWRDLTFQQLWEISLRRIHNIHDTIHRACDRYMYDVTSYLILPRYVNLRHISFKTLYNSCHHKFYIYTFFRSYRFQTLLPSATHTLLMNSLKSASFFLNAVGSSSELPYGCWFDSMSGLYL